MFQTRGALAITLCLITLMTRIRILKLLLIIMACLIHSAIFFVSFVYICAKFLEKKQNRFNYNWLGGVALFLAIIFSILLSYKAQNVLGAIGDRRAIYNTGTNSFLYLSFWVILAFSLLFTRKLKSPTEYWEDYYLIIMLTLPFLMKIFGVTGIRFIALSFPFIIIAIFKRITPVKEFLIGSLFVYQLIQYAYWLKII
jgi:hypothetical protein